MLPKKIKKHTSLVSTKKLIPKPYLNYVLSFLKIIKYGKTTKNK